MNVFSVVLAVTVVALGGCAAPRPTPTFAYPAYDEADYAALPTSGSGVVRGQVFAKTVGGDVKKGAGSSVVLFPATRYGDARYHQEVVGGKRAVKAEDPGHLKFVRVKVADGDGKFEFTELPAGKYYVVSNITWSVPTYDRFLGAGMQLQGGKVYRQIEVKDGAVTDAMLVR